MLRRFLCVIALAAAAARLDAQSCTAPPSDYHPYFSCFHTGRCTAGETVTFGLSFPSYPTSPSCVSAVWTFSDGTAGATTAGRDTFTRTFPAGPRTAHVVITSGSQTAAKDVTVNVGRGLVGIEVATPEITEGQPATFVISRTNADMSTDVPWHAFSQGAEPTSPYISPVQGVVTLNAGQLSAQLTLTTLQDSVFTGEKRYSVRIGPAPGTLSNDYLVGPDEYDTVNVHEDDWSLIDFTDNPVTVREDAGTGTTAFRRSGNLDQAVDVYYSIQGTHFDSVHGQLHFAPGETLQTFTFPIPNDGTWTGDRRGQINMHSFSRGAKYALPNHSALIPFAIQEDEPAPVVTVDDLSIPELDAGTQQALLNFRISHSVPFTSFQLSWRTMSGTALLSDYGSRSGSFTFSAANPEFTIPINISGDTLYEPDESFEVALQLGTSVSQFPLPPNPTITILNDDPDIQPGSATIDRGQSATFAIDAGLAAPSAQTFPVSASEPSVVAVPASVNVGAGTSHGTFEVGGISPGTSTVSVQLAGGKMLSANVTVRPGGMAMFHPDALTQFTGEESTVELSLHPPSVQTHQLELIAGDPGIASVSPMVTIPAGGSGTFTVTGIARGVTHVSAVLPAEFGGGTAVLPINVNAHAQLPTLRAIEPSRGVTAGGTAFRATGSQLAPDCRLLFGGVPATLFTLASDGTFLGQTPPHASGAVDVTLDCNAARFVLKNAYTYIAMRGRGVRH